MSAFAFLPGPLGDIIGGMLATMAFDPGPGLTIVKTAAPAQSCSAPAPAFVAMLSNTAIMPAQAAPLTPSAQTIRRAPDGLFYIDAVVNGATVRFLIDTGATMIVLTKDDAARVGVLPPAAEFDATANTAGGETSMARVKLARLNVGRSIDFDVPAAVAKEGLGVSLLGASWLTQLGSVTITGDRMLLQ